MLVGEDVMGLPSSRGKRVGRRWSTCGRCGFIPEEVLRLREVVLSGQDTLRAFLTEAAASVRRVYSGPVSYSALPFERVNPEHELWEAIEGCLDLLSASRPMLPNADTSPNQAGGS
jgi:hypothetical protein